MDLVLYYLEFVYKLLPQSESSFRRKPESSPFKTFWMPDQVRHDGKAAFINRHYLVLIGAWLGSIYYLSGGVKKLSALKHSREGILLPKTKAMRTIEIGSFLTVLWTVIIIVSIYNQLSSPIK